MSVPQGRYLGLCSLVCPFSKQSPPHSQYSRAPALELVIDQTMKVRFEGEGEQGSASLASGELESKVDKISQETESLGHREIQTSKREFVKWIHSLNYDTRMSHDVLACKLQNQKSWWCDSA